ncbi:DUF1501 domain-containing protein [Roseiconus lacunae]|uniref:DUF1501 domain-containing protein n=1 Tax=Roseiconus lacunae TaxID=2605694 RepID=A0ABT7PKH0_9BACT|nr:DUF1501 domain-containing protein [Roseiconus lacunae]MCD0461082.1 DUF1501 domain-containing protein [Roseiconus lacunae]MDM4016986.1 DUF1501 domain-containing protein [Roseiconus lacunae]WRQ48920.1 DUF1501 domain-containing protein [Stieleria sp. HD01]
MSVTRTFDRFSRRDLVRIAAASFGGICCSPWLPRLAKAAGGKRPPKACILLWMSGGPSQMETLSPKPGHGNGGPTRAISTAVPGIEVSENLPGLAKQMKDVAIIRSMKTREGDHGRATQLMLTGYRPMGGMTDYPVFGSMVSHRLKMDDHPLPGFVSIAPFQRGNLGAGFLGPDHSPLLVSGASNDPNTRANLTIENMDIAGGDTSVLAERQALLSMMRQGAPSTSTSAVKHASVYDQAMRMIESRGEGAFELDEEKPELRDAYGRNRFGQGCLLARRLVERGVPFVEVTLDQTAGATWDSHLDNFNVVRSMCEVLDPAWSTLIDDLRQRKMLDSTMVVWMGEFGRTPRINPNSGRDHFPDAWSVALAGGAIAGGQSYGKTSKDGMEVIDNPVHANDLFATMLQGLGIDSWDSNMNGDRPIPLVDEGGTPVEELLG